MSDRIDRAAAWLLHRFFLAGFWLIDVVHALQHPPPAESWGPPDCGNPRCPSCSSWRSTR